MKKSGFTLIELMIVVAIIAIIAAIAIPGMLRARMAANEANAIGSLRTISTAQIQYQSAAIDTTNSINQYGDLDALSAATPPFLDALLGVEGSVKAGYVFETNVTEGSSSAAAQFEATAESQSDNLGSRNFYVDEAGVVYWVPRSDGSADSTDSPL
jgi:prepilin-type N-terminal cleavage/methylation domain-containing protein